MRKLWISGVALIVDQVTKWLVVSRMDLYESIPVLGDVFRLTYIHNPGAVFGLRFGGPYLHLAFSVVAMGAVALMIRRLEDDERVAGVGLALVLGGAIGNVLDRLELFYPTNASVVDFLDFGFGDTRWYVFNVADACVTTGVALLILTYGLFGQKEGQVDEPDGVAGQRE